MGGTTPRAGINPEQRVETDRIRARLGKEVERIRAQKNLTREGKAAQLARAVDQAQDKLTELGTGETEDLLASDARITSDFFGHYRPDPTQIISIRDAADRAARIKNAEECAKLMNRAELHGDTVLLRALAQECAQRRTPMEPAYGTLFEQWAEQQPGGPEALEQLAGINHELHDTGARLLRERAFSVGPLPEELRGVGNLKALAQQADANETDDPNATARADTSRAASAAFDQTYR